MKNKYEENPFEDEIVAKEWINSIENERGMIREKELFPMTHAWALENNFKTIVDIGMGQGSCADAVQINEDVKYIGIEPSKILVDRAIEKYSKKNREFMVGNAYELPISDEIADGTFSLNVWFHLKDLDAASKELARILKPGGKFYICTANPDSYDNWRSRFEPGAIEDEEVIDGKVYVPINPLSRNRFYKHSMKSILDNFEKHNLKIDTTIKNGIFDTRNGPEVPLFINFFGHKE